jgi:hypothetical protein
MVTTTQVTTTQVTGTVLLTKIIWQPNKTTLNGTTEKGFKMVVQTEKLGQQHRPRDLSP